MVILDNDGRVSEVYAAHDSGKVVNPISIQGQIEGGVLMGMGYALTEDWPLKDCVPQARYGTLGLFRAPEIPDIHAIYVEKDELLPVAYGGKGIGEIATIPTAPAVQNAYRAFDGKLRPDLPWWIRRTVAPVTAGRVGCGQSLPTGCSRSTSNAYAGPLAPTPSRAGAFCLKRKLCPGIQPRNGMNFPNGAACGNCIPDSTLRVGFVFR